MLVGKGSNSGHGVKFLPVLNSNFLVLQVLQIRGPTGIELVHI